ncbi:transposase [Pseudomonas wenzhouensis]|nr:transposase [Pseudomonas wenzhouensis]MDM9653869.1 transposase [Pseudomonas wenzhouensis]
MTSSPNLDQLTPDQLRALAAQLLTQVDAMGKKIHRDQTVIEQLTHEIAWFKRHKFAKRSEQLGTVRLRRTENLNHPGQRSFSAGAHVQRLGGEPDALDADHFSSSRRKRAQPSGSLPGHCTDSLPVRWGIAIWMALSAALGTRGIGIKPEGTAGSCACWRRIHLCTRLALRP